MAGLSHVLRQQRWSLVRVVSSPRLFLGGVAPVVLAAIVLFALAFFSPVETVASDSAIALLVAQSILDHGTFGLEVWMGEPELAYDLDHHRLIKKRGESYLYYAAGVPLLSVPAVWLANRFGFHMLRQEDEFALQNLLSALCVAAAFVLLYRLALVYLSARAAFLVASVSTAGSSLVSTLATGLWNSDYAVLLGCLSLLAVARHDAGKTVRLRWTLVALWLGLAFLCRPAMAFLILTVLVYGALDSQRPRLRLAAGALLALVAVGVGASYFGFLQAVPYYYAPQKLFGPAPVMSGILGSLISPSRGVLVTSPFLVVVVVGVALRIRRLRSQRMLWLMLGWIAVHVLAVAQRQWWGGHSFGARMLVELMPAFAIVTCLLWRSLASDPGRRFARAGAFVYLSLGALAIGIHSGQGLFNKWVTVWNVQPNIDAHTEMLWSWRHPQFLASEASLEERSVEHQRARLEPYRLGDTIGPESSQAVFLHWYASEGDWRWTWGQSSALAFELDSPLGGELGLLEIVAGSLGRQEVSLRLNETPLGTLTLDGFAPQGSAHLVELADLRFGQENRLLFDVPDARPMGEDHRALGLALRSLRLRRLPSPTEGVVFSDDALFIGGFSQAEPTFRWTDGPRATLLYPLEVVKDSAYSLEIVAGAYGEQVVDVSVNGTAAGRMVLSGFEPASRTVTVPAEALRPRALNRIELAIGRPRSPPGDPRRLGLAFVRARLAAVEGSDSMRGVE